jgi:hypothetical protein
MADPITSWNAGDKGADLKDKFNANFDKRFSRDTKAVTATTYAVALTDEFLRADATSNAVTLNLPPASTATDKTYWVEAVNVANTITLDPDGAELINGAATKTIGTAGRLTVIYCDGTGWFAWFMDRLP